MFHPLQVSADTIIPEIFNNPFYYSPHPFCILAADAIQKHLSLYPHSPTEIEQGKMFGALIVQTPTKEIGYLAAFSGILDGKNQHEYFVPPVYDFLSEESFFRIEETAISNISMEIQKMKSSEEYLQAKTDKIEAKQWYERKIEDGKRHLKQGKKERELKRRECTDKQLLEILTRESQHQKAEWKRQEKRLKEELNARTQKLNCWELEIARKKEERKLRSAALQKKIFECFVMRNAQGNEKNLIDIFATTPQQYPPAGAGECAGPKLLQYAYQHNMKPVALAEFWVGQSPKDEIRYAGHFYPACRGKCGPILSFMLQGLNVAPNPLELRKETDTPIEVLYEDEWLVIVNKPSGLLSAPGKGEALPVSSYIHTSMELTAVHRLDMATSGILILAKNKDILSKLQAQFEYRAIKKRYIALIDGVIDRDNGEISLPLIADYNERPRQKVDYERGKKAITRYEVLERYISKTRVAFYPETGRTHQLRIHAAHTDGLNSPIVGDELYGRAADRLYLHAEFIMFEHPVSGVVVKIECKPDF